MYKECYDCDYFETSGVFEVPCSVCLLRPDAREAAALIQGADKIHDRVQKIIDNYINSVKDE